jgi:hypothetical protein
MIKYAELTFMIFGFLIFSQNTYTHLMEHPCPRENRLGKAALTDIILSALSQQKQIDGTLCDLSKAFNCINHKILLDKFYYGICGINAQWFESYLIHRKQKVEII